MTAYRVLVVDDSAFMRKIFSDIIEGEPDFSVVGTASTGQEAVEQLQALKPDVITLDLEMPVMNGFEALRRMMTIDPVPVIMLSGISEEGLRETIRALQYGAFDFIHKPDAAALDLRTVAEQLISRLRAAVLVKRRMPPREAADAAGKPEGLKTPEKSPPRGLPAKTEALAPFRNRRSGGARTDTEATAPLRRKPSASPASIPPRAVKPDPQEPLEPAAAKQPKAVPSEAFRDLIAIGTSTGGPRALHAVLTALPFDLKAPVLVVQHMPPKFTLSLAQRLDSFASLNVREAADGDRLEAGNVYIAPGGRHMTVARSGGAYRIRLTDDGLRGGHRPSVDVLFESLLDCPELRRHIVLMTGMGSDGAQGMKALAEQGVATAIAEAEETCVVYGMPRSAIERGAANQIVPLPDIAPRLVDAVNA